MEYTIVHGKDLYKFTLDSNPVSWLDDLRREVEKHCNIAIAHQKLVYRGKEMSIKQDQLPSGSKIMLLTNKLYHQQIKANTATNNSIGSSANTKNELKEHSEKDVPVIQRAVSTIDVASIDDQHVLLHASRGKMLYEFVFRANETILDVKTRISKSMGISPLAIRLIVKGKTPSDDAILQTFISDNVRVIKCMVLLNAEQHELLENEQEFQRFQKDLTMITMSIYTLERQMRSNLLPREQVLVELHVLQDSMERVIGNRNLLEAQFHQSRLARTSATMKALDHAKTECQALEQQVEILVRRFTPQSE